MTLTIRDSVFEPFTDSRTIVVRRPADKPALYRVFLYLEGEELPYVRSVTYILDPTFAEPERTVERSSRNPNCQLIIWTWGVFTVDATVQDRRGQTYKLSRLLTYDRQFDEPGVTYKNER